MLPRFACMSLIVCLGKERNKIKSNEARMTASKSCLMARRKQQRASGARFKRLSEAEFD